MNGLQLRAIVDAAHADAAFGAQGRAMTELVEWFGNVAEVSQIYSAAYLARVREIHSECCAEILNRRTSE